MTNEDGKSMDKRIEQLKMEYPEYFCGEVVTAQDFLDMQIESKETYPENVQKKITIRDIEDLKNATCISINNGDGLLCVTDEGDIESVLKKNGAQLDGFLNIAFVNGINNGGTKLDCYNCAGATPGKGSTLGDNYCKRGFFPVCRIRFNRLMVDPIMAKTYGEPEVIFFIYCGDTIEDYITKLHNKEYPGLNKIKYIPYIDEIQDMLGMDADDTDYCFALEYRNVLCEKWINEFREKYNGDYVEFLEYVRLMKWEVKEWLNSKGYASKSEKSTYSDLEMVHMMSSQLDENGELIYEKDDLHLLLDVLGDSRVAELKEADLPAVKYDFYLNNYHIWNIDEHPGLLICPWGENNVYQIGDRDYFLMADENKEKAMLLSCSHSEDGLFTEFFEMKKDIADEDVTVEYVFNNKNLSKLVFLMMPFMVYRENLLWFIDFDENGSNAIFSYAPLTKELKKWPVVILQNIMGFVPIHIKDNCFVYFCLQEDDYYSLFDFTAIKVNGSEEAELNRIGEIVGINDRYVYSKYGIEYYRLDMETMKKKSLERIDVTDDNLSVAFVDAARDIVYSTILEYDLDDLESTEDEPLQSMPYKKDYNFDMFTKGGIKLKAQSDDNPEFMFESNSELLDKLDEEFGEADYFRIYGDYDLIGIDANGIVKKIWAVPEIIPDAQEYDCSFVGYGFEYFER